MSIAVKAMSSVSRAIQTGHLAPLDGTISCVDCGRSATCYDHREYAKPLDVSPVCWSCNRRRGKAIDADGLEGFVVRIKLSRAIYREIKGRATKERRTIHNMLRVVIEDGLSNTRAL